MDTVRKPFTGWLGRGFDGCLTGSYRAAVEAYRAKAPVESFCGKKIRVRSASAQPYEPGQQFHGAGCAGCEEIARERGLIG